MVKPDKTIIMVVDDDEFIQKLLDDTLYSEGYGVVLAGSAEETYQSLSRITPDLFVIDIILPGQDGLQLCQTIRKNPQYGNLPILILSSKHTVSDRVKGLQYGADDYLVKPFHLEELVARVNALLRRHTAEGETSTKPARGSAQGKAVALEPESDSYSARKKMALRYFQESMYEESLQLWEELIRERPKDIETKKYVEITRTQLMKKYMAVLGSKNAIPIRKSDKSKEFIGLDFNTEEGFIFSRIDSVTDLKTIVSISGMKPLKAYRVLYNFHKSGVIKLKQPGN